MLLESMHQKNNKKREDAFGHAKDNPHEFPRARTREIDKQPGWTGKLTVSGNRYAKLVWHIEIDTVEIPFTKLGLADVLIIWTPTNKLGIRSCSMHVSSVIYTTELLIIKQVEIRV